MPAEKLNQRFERMLTPEVYEAAWRYASRLRATREDAEDLLQESLLQALSKLGALRDETSFRGWLLSIVRRKSIDQFRRMKARPAVTRELPQLAAYEADDALSEHVLAALNQLPVAQQELLSLFYLDGLTLKETGQVLGIPPRAVRQRLFRARTALRGKLTLPLAQGQPLRQVGGECNES